MSWIQTASGRQFWPLRPSAEDVDLEDIAHALAMKCRYSGHTQQFYSVAEHSVYVSRYCSQAVALWGLLHDASEAYLPDVSRPIKPHLTGFADIEAGVMRAMCHKFGLPHAEPAEVKAIDTRILLNEKAVLMPHTPADWGIEAEPLPGLRIECWTPTEAKTQFLRRFKELVG
jgi:hypothetical protein